MFELLIGFVGVGPGRVGVGVLSVCYVWRCREVCCVMCGVVGRRVVCCVLCVVCCGCVGLLVCCVVPLLQCRRL